MFGILFRIFLFGLIIYVLFGLLFGGYSQIVGDYYWMRPTPTL